LRFAIVLPTMLRPLRSIWSEPQHVGTLPSESAELQIICLE
jgi:hypothetical protein